MSILRIITHLCGQLISWEVVLAKYFTCFRPERLAVHVLKSEY